MAQFNYHLYTILLSCLLPVTPLAIPADCPKCTLLPSDCKPDHDDASFSSGIPCACTNTHQPNGCILKPCDFVETDDICDCTLSTGSLLKSSNHSHRLSCRKYQCTGNSGECEFCKDMPFDCTNDSYLNPPSAGGPDCACEAAITPGGCTLKTCGNDGGSGPCVPRNGVSDNSTLIWYGSTCPGKLNSISARKTDDDHRPLPSAEGWVVVGGILVGLAVVFGIVFGIRICMGLIEPEFFFLFGYCEIILIVNGVMFLVKGFWLLKYK